MMCPPTVKRLVKGKFRIQLCIRDPLFRLETTMKKCRHSDVANERFVKNILDVMLCRLKRKTYSISERTEAEVNGPWFVILAESHCVVCQSPNQLQT